MMRRQTAIAGIVLILSSVLPAGLRASGDDPGTVSGVERWREAPRITSSTGVGSVRPSELTTPSGLHSVSAETLWIFDADFENLTGDNAGWTTYDRSGTLAQVNYWHKDTIRINGFTHLGDSTWWCGTYNDCWRQPRGYGNNWMCSLERAFPEVAAMTEPGDPMTLEYDQRFAIEKDYDYGYVEVSTDGGENWTSIHGVTNSGFMETPGYSEDWDSDWWANPGHIVLDLSAYSGAAMSIRFRFESDSYYSSEDTYNNPPLNTCLDGAWQLDNIRLWAVTAFVGTTTIFLDDCESPGSNGWVHDDVPATGQTGVVFTRGLYGVDFDTWPNYSCDSREGWMYAAVDPFTGWMVDGQHSWLMSPPIDIDGVTEIVGQWDMWVDTPEASHDIYNLYLASKDMAECISVDTRFVDEHPGWWWGGPHWVTESDDWTPFAGNSWLGIVWAVRNEEPPEPGAEHRGGIFLNRQRVGIPIGTPAAEWQYGTTCGTRFRDMFEDDLAGAALDSALISAPDDNGVASVLLLASNNGGATWSAYPCLEGDPDDSWWTAPPPLDLMERGKEIVYYFEATDGVGGVSTLPQGAPDAFFEFSILPVNASVSDPGVLLVDKHCALTPGEDRSYAHRSLYYYREALDILGYDYDVFETEFPGAACSASDGPDTSGMKYYDTQVWITGNVDEHTLTPLDQFRLTQWLSQASEGAERNLLVAGNDVGQDLIAAGGETLSFYTTWLSAEFLSSSVGEVTTDSLPRLRDAVGRADFMTFDDRRCVLRGGCPELGYFDVVRPYPGVLGAELVAEYVRTDMTAIPAGVAYTDTVTGYQTVTLGFGIESMVDVPLPNGHYTSGSSDRVDLMSNVMDYFERAPVGSGTGVTSDDLYTDSLDHAYPNPFNPRTTIEFSTRARGRVTARVYDLAGRTLRTLVDEILEPGSHRTSWDGQTDVGAAPSGVYFVRIDAPGFQAMRKLVLLK